jgi:hypothetical protein
VLTWFESQSNFHEGFYESAGGNVHQEIEPMSNKTRLELQGFYRHFGTKEYDAAREAGYTGCKPHGT